ncbi:MAG: hypothetical protein CMJ42_01905 [Phyllobacteriaceae bacterium]|nr:hypothetical protein [Phyllobacteriaceae bacterium]MBA90412.1 hypothetical protein [Phyllobacteriaceae bacterium]
MLSRKPIAGVMATALLGALLAMAAPGQGEAASALCQRLEARLASMERGTGRSPALMRRYRVAIAEQKRQMQIATRRARQIGCGGGVFPLRRGDASQCARINQSLADMRANLADLQRQLASSGRGDARAGAAERRRILAAIRANRCREEPEQRVVRRLPESIESARRDFELRKRLFESQDREVRENRNVTILRPGLSGQFDGGTYRTLCVRTCDGYYFPLSFSTTPDFFYRDQDACQAMCPGVDVRLYAHRSGVEEPEDMVSITGEPYTALPTAFAYRDPKFTSPAGCACNPAKDFAVIGGAEKTEEPGETDPSETAEPVAPVPWARPDPAADPETAANAAGGLTAERLRSLLEPEENPAEDGERRIRVVGPTFLPDPEEAIDLKAPGRNAAR